MRLVFLGPPGAGKGTQAVRAAQELGIAHVSTGDMLRSAVARGTPAGKKAEPIMKAGGLVPDEVVLEMVDERLGSDAAEGFILDGYPRTLKQGEDLDRILSRRGMKLDAALELELAEEVIVPRMAGRRSCPKDGRIYHVTANPPKVPGVCDACGGPLIQRPDDREEVVRKRMEEYRAKTTPLTDWYRAKGILVRVDANGTVDQVWARVKEALSKVAKAKGGRG